MFSRILFLLLFAANVGMGAWLYVSPRARTPEPVSYTHLTLPTN